MSRKRQSGEAVSSTKGVAGCLCSLFILTMLLGSYLKNAKKSTGKKQFLRTKRSNDDDFTQILAESGQSQHRWQLINQGLDKVLFIEQATDQDAVNAGIPLDDWLKIKKATHKLLLSKENVYLLAGACPASCHESGLSWGVDGSHPICSCRITMSQLMPTYFVSDRHSCFDIGCSPIKTAEACVDASRWLALSSKVSLNMKQLGHKRPQGCHYRDGFPGSDNDLWFNAHPSKTRPTSSDLSICDCSIKNASQLTTSVPLSPKPTQLFFYEQVDSDD